MSSDSSVELPSAAQAVRYLEFVQDWLSGATNDAMLRLGLVNGEAPPPELRLLVNVEELRSMIAALGEIREVLMAKLIKLSSEWAMAKKRPDPKARRRNVPTQLAPRTLPGISRLVANLH